MSLGQIYLMQREEGQGNKAIMSLDRKRGEGWLLGSSSLANKLLGGPSFSETLDRILGMDTMVCYFECEPSSSSSLVRSSLYFTEILALTGILFPHYRLSQTSHTPKVSSLSQHKLSQPKCIYKQWGRR